MKYKISDQFSFRRLLLYALPSIVMMIFMSLYTIVDGYFVSALVGSDALSAVNIVYPVWSLLGAISLMFATGGSALIAEALGRGEPERANRLMTFFVLTTVAICTLIAAGCLAFLDPLLGLLGANETLLPYCRQYLMPLLLFAPMSALQMLFQSYFVSASRPMLGFTLTVAGGIANMVLDYLLIAPAAMGVAGAAVATGIGACIPAVGGLVFFAGNRGGLRFSRPSCTLRALGKAMFNGSSEMVTNLAGSLTTLLFNLFMMRLIGSQGVAAITVVLYSQFLLSSLFLGFSMGVAPVLSYNLGAGNRVQLKRLLRISYAFTSLASVLVVGAALLLASPIAGIFSNGDAELRALIIRGLRLFSLGYLLMGFNIFTSAMFTALSCGLTSAAVSFSRTLLFSVVFLCTLPLLWQVDGLFLAIPFAEICTAAVSALCLKFVLPRALPRPADQASMALRQEEPAPAATDEP